MAEVVNLNRARKARALTAAKAKAQENRAKFGRAQSEKSVATALNELERRYLDQAKRELSASPLADQQNLPGDNEGDPEQG